MVEDKVLELQVDGRPVLVEFPDRVVQRLELPSLLIVRTEPAKGTINNENVYGVSRFGRIEWRIEAATAVYGDSPYINVASKPDGLHAYNWDGGDVRIDITNGRILDQKQGK